MDKQAKDKLLSEVEYGNLGSRQKFKPVEKIVCCMFVCTVIACIVACCCAGFCYSAMSEIQTLKQNANRPGTTPPTTAEAIKVDAIPGRSEALRKTVDEPYEELYDEVDDYEENEYEEYFDEEYDDNDYEDDYDEYEDDDDYIYDQNVSADLTVEGSGNTDEQQSDDTETTQLRRRRDVSSDVKKCKKQCKGSKKEKRQCRQACNKSTKSASTPKISHISLQMKLPAAHFESFSDREVKETFGDSFDTYENKAGIPLKIFHPAQWVDETSPVNFSDSVATARYTGAALVYAQAYIGDAEPIKSISVVQKRDGNEISALTCNTGVHASLQTGQHQTCFVQGLMNLRTGDTIEVQRSITTPTVECDKDKTFFGIVQLTTVPDSDKPKTKKGKHSN